MFFILAIVRCYYIICSKWEICLIYPYILIIIKMEKKIKPNHPKTIAFARFIILLSLFTGGNLLAQVKMSEEPWILPTYPVEQPEKAPIFFTHESYQGASRYVYPNPLQDVISDQRVDRAWKALRLENEYIQLCITPEIGGKLYHATERALALRPLSKELGMRLIITFGGRAESPRRVHTINEASKGRLAGELIRRR